MSRVYDRCCCPSGIIISVKTCGLSALVLFALSCCLSPSAAPTRANLMMIDFSGTHPGDRDLAGARTAPQRRSSAGWLFQIGIIAVNRRGPEHGRADAHVPIAASLADPDADAALAEFFRFRDIISRWPWCSRRVWRSRHWGAGRPPALGQPGKSHSGWRRGESWHESQLVAAFTAGRADCAADGVGDCTRPGSWCARATISARAIGATMRSRVFLGKTLDVRKTDYPEFAQRLAIFRRVIDEAEGELPDVRAAAIMAKTLAYSMGPNVPLRTCPGPGGVRRTSGRRVEAVYSEVSENFFATLGVESFGHGTLFHGWRRKTRERTRSSTRPWRKNSGRGRTCCSANSTCAIIGWRPRIRPTTSSFAGSSRISRPQARAPRSTTDSLCPLIISGPEPICFFSCGAKS